MPCTGRTNSGRYSRSTNILIAPRDLTWSSTLLLQSSRKVLSARFKQFNFRDSNISGMPTDQRVTQPAVSHPRVSRSKHHQPTNCRPTPSPFCAENFPIKTSEQPALAILSVDRNKYLSITRAWRIDCPRRLPDWINSTVARPTHLPNIPANHPFLGDFKACWNCSFTKLGSLA